jgi:catechol 2,3-dioxygenase-like lactoylglutathione lyase family enzyme
MVKAIAVTARRTGMTRSLAAVALVVADYDEAISWFVGMLGFALIEDTPMGNGKRWVVVAAGPSGARLLLARASGETQAAAMGNQAGGRVGFFLETDDFTRDYADWSAKGVRFEEQPRLEDFGTVAVFRDLYGNRWDLIGRK